MEDMRKAFRPVAEKWRRQARQGGIAFASILAVLVVSFCMQWKAGFFIAWAAMGYFFLLAIISAAVALRIACPGCGELVLAKRGPHCPECGEKAVQEGTWFRHPACTACGKLLSSGGKGGRRYRIRSCTHCGCRLDDAGI